jgi:hypothetical protein
MDIRDNKNDSLYDDNQHDDSFIEPENERSYYEMNKNDVIIENTNILWKNVIEPYITNNDVLGCRVLDKLNANSNNSYMEFVNFMFMLFDK